MKDDKGLGCNTRDKQMEKGAMIRQGNAHAMAQEEMVTIWLVMKLSKEILT